MTNQMLEDMLEAEEAFCLLQLELRANAPREGLVKTYFDKCRSLASRNLRKNGRAPDSDGKSFYPYIQLIRLLKIQESKKFKDFIMRPGADNLFVRSLNLSNVLGDYYGNFVDSLIASGKINLKEQASSKGKCVELSDETGLLDGNMFLKFGEAGKLKDEVQIQNLLMESLRADEAMHPKKFFIPKAFPVREYGGETFYPMEHVYGERLDKRIHRTLSNPPLVKSCLERVVDFLAWIHVNVLPVGDVNLDEVKEKYKKDRGQKIMTAFDKLGLEESKAAGVADSLNLVLEEPYNSAPFVFYKDAQPRNWIVAPNGAINALDFDIHGHDNPSLPEYDLVCLLESIPKAFTKKGSTKFPLADDERKDLIRLYGGCYSQYSGKSFRTPEESRRVYLNLSIERALLMARTFDLNEGIERDKSRWNGMVMSHVTNAIFNTDLIKTEYPRGYSRFGEQYERLKGGLLEIRGRVCALKVHRQ